MARLIAVYKGRLTGELFEEPGVVEFSEDNAYAELLSFINEGRATYGYLQSTPRKNKNGDLEITDIVGFVNKEPEFMPDF